MIIIVYLQRCACGRSGGVSYVDLPPCPLQELEMLQLPLVRVSFFACWGCCLLVFLQNMHILVQRHSICHFSEIKYANIYQEYVLPLSYFIP